MSKNPLNEKIIPDIVKVSQSIEGYNASTKESREKTKKLMDKYGIKVESKKEQKC